MSNETKKSAGVHHEYLAACQVWSRCRDAYDGNDAVKNQSLSGSTNYGNTQIKGKVTRYLPVPEAMDVSTELGMARYQAYVARALWFGATTRTVDAFTAGIFQQAPEFQKTSPRLEEHLEDVNLHAVPADLYMARAAHEVLIQGRGGVLVDWAGEGKDARPFWTLYRAEDIVDWEVKHIQGRPVLVRVVIREVKVKNPQRNAITLDTETLYRFLELTSNGYTSTVYRESQRGPEYLEQVGPTVRPMRRGQALDFIPWTWLSATTLEARVQRPPLLDLVDLNLSHFRTSADLEHGLHYVGTPQLVLIGGLNNSGKPVEFGSGRALLLPKDSDAKILQADGNLMGALEKAEERKRKLMATLGARLLDNSPQVERDTATAVIARSQGEHATLRSIANAMEMAFTRVLRIHEWWLGSAAHPDELECAASLNKDFLSTRMSPEELKNWVLALQAEAVSHETFWHALVRGGIARPGVTSEEELEQIEEERPEVDMEMPNAEGAPNPSGAGAEGGGSGAYRVIQKDGQWVVTDASGKVVPGGAFGQDQAAAKRHRSKLEGKAAPQNINKEGNGRGPNPKGKA